MKLWVEGTAAHPPVSGRMPYTHASGGGPPLAVSCVAVSQSSGQEVSVRTASGLGVLCGCFI